jgi:hypothetical protein
MFKILVHTQDKENYGAHDWDGEGACPQYWKFKGGDSVVVGEIALQDVIDLRYSGTLERYVRDLIEKFDIEVSNEYFETYVLDWELVTDEDIVVSNNDGEIQCMIFERDDLDYAGGFRNALTDERGYFFMVKS